MRKFKYPRMTLTQLGELYGVTNQQVGKWLASAGLRDNRGKPTRLAHDGGYCEQAPSRNDMYVWAWRPEKVVPVLEQHGHTMLRMPPLNLVEPPPLAGPFGVRTDADGFSEITNADGTLAALVPGRPQAERLVGVLNLAHKHSKFGHGSPTP
jgi:hypothetical protein